MLTRAATVQSQGFFIYNNRIYYNTSTAVCGEKISRLQEFCIVWCVVFQGSAARLLVSFIICSQSRKGRSIWTSEILIPKGSKCALLDVAHYTVHRAMGTTKV